MMYLLPGLALIAGLIVGWLLARSASRAGSLRVMASARAEAARLQEAARQAAALTIREYEGRAREEAQEMRRSSELLEQQSAEENALAEERLRKLEARNAAHEGEIAAREAALQEREEAVREAKAAERATRQQAAERREGYRSGLEERAGETADQIRGHLTEALVEETRAQCGDRLRNLESTSSAEFMREAKRIMGISLGRYRGHFPIERVSSTMTLSAESMAKLTGNVEALQLIEESSGVHLSFGESGETLRFEGGDGAARELARRVVTRVVSEARIRDLERLIKAVGGDLDREIIGSGKEAFRLLDLPLAHPEIVKLVGRLNFRTSYTQNQWQHAIESGFFGGLMAAELRLDIMLARRASLLHDIGKALSHEIEGSHALIGADYARRYEEDEIIINAIASHHADEPARSPYAYLVAAADAISGARPGARREMVETYVDRISDLERIANHFRGVVLVHAVQAGRELRVHVDERQVNDSRASELSELIARKISDDLTFPGQIRVTVIREFKAVEVAR